ncbi:hypothetical protein [Streptomyces sp. NPDC007172]|uniref:hypothetical protein n=1 Tax=Streptomyces sp. NPDC007172 TaxID=3364776 RepID=UPI003688967A
MDGRELYDVLYEGGTPQVGRDARLRMAGLMDRCPTWDTELPGLPDQVEISENVKELAWSVGYAWLQATRGHHVGCLVFPTADRHGWHPVSPVKGTHVGSGSGHVYFLAQPLELLDFWRSLFAKEDVAEADFFDRAEDAYPGLVFADSLSFGKFDGSYAEMRDWVVKALSVLNDYFSVALVKHAGQPEEI